MSDIAMQAVSETFVALNSLESISLCFTEWENWRKILDYLFVRCHKITDVGMNYLGEALKTLTSLQRMNLKFRW